jgi:excisionase family DNA binding protein
MKQETDLRNNPVGRLIAEHVQQARDIAAARGAAPVKAPKGAEKERTWLSVNEAAAALEVSRQRIWQMIRAGNLPAKVVGCRYMISRVNIERAKLARAAVQAAKQHPMYKRKRKDKEKK